MSTATNPLEALLNVVAERTAKANKIATRAKSALGDRAKSIREARENSDDPQVAKFREFYEQTQQALLDAQTKIDALIVEKGLIEGGGEVWSEADKEKHHAEYKEHAKFAKDSRKALEAVYATTGMTAPEFPELLTFTGGKSAAGGSTGIKRPRFDSIVVNGETVKSLSDVSQKIKSKSGKSVGAADLFKVLTDSAGTDDLYALNDHTVTITETDDNNVVHEFEVTVYKAQNVEE